LAEPLPGVCSVRRTAVIIAIIVAGCALLALTSSDRHLRQRPAGGPDPFALNPLLGKPAPSFVTVDPDDKTIDLKSHLGRDVIMLDFWATWCGPCIIAMPHIAEVAKKYEGKGFVFYSVNVGEDPDTVKGFLDQMNLDMRVAMDFDGKIQKMFQGSFLPYTVLIGKDGTVQAAYLGFREDLSAKLSRDIEALLAGNQLVKPQ
jgi:thiol-disulfide isomerase/thioredoxin